MKDQAVGERQRDADGARQHVLRRHLRQVKHERHQRDAGEEAAVTPERGQVRADGAAELLGPYAQLTKGNGHAIDDGQWAYSYLRARGNTIEAGTSEIQRNIVGHFVLGLPKSY